MSIAGPARAYLESAYTCALALSRRRKRDPLRFIRWLPLQYRYLKSLSRFRLLRAGNQAQGKTTVALADLLLDALGEHPFRPCESHGEYWIICASWSQSVAIQRKLHALIPPDRLRDGTVYTDLRGFRGKNPAVEVRHKKGGWSVIRFRTTRQGSLNLAGATIRGALFDEVPTTESIYAEVVKRVMATGGWVAIAATPIGAPVEWIRELAERGGIEDLHSRLTPESMVYEGTTVRHRLGDGTVCDAAWIAKVEKETPPSEVDVRVHGEWETRTIGRYFTVFTSSGPNSHVSTAKPQGRAKILLGIDMGHRPGKQVAILIAIVEPRTVDENPRIFILDEYVAKTGLETPKEDAQGIKAMIEANGLTWHKLDYVCGDRVHLPGTAQQKSSKDLQVQLAKLYRVPPDDLRPQVRTTNKRKDSVPVGCRWLFHAMSRPGHFNVDPRCKRTISALDNYLGPKSLDDEHHDPVDAIRYACEQHVWGGWKRGPGGPVRLG